MSPGRCPINGIRGPATMTIPVTAITTPTTISAQPRACMPPAFTPRPDPRHRTPSAHPRGSACRRRLVDPAVAVDLGVVPGALQEPVDDARRPAAAAGDRAGGGVVDRDLEDPRRAVDDGGEVVLLVEVEPVGGAEAVTERGADPPRPRRRPDDREGLEAEPEAPGARPLADHHVEGKVLHPGIEDLLHGAVQP